MSRIIFNNPTQLLGAIRFAREAGCTDQLGRDLLRLIECLGVGMTADNERRAEVWPDFAPHSLAWCIYDGQPAIEHVVLAGGWIYAGPTAPGDGSFPGLSVNLDYVMGQAPTHSWSVHT